MSKQLINERAYMQKVAGLITESEYVAIVNEEESDFVRDYKAGAVNRDLSDYEKSLVGIEEPKIKGSFVPRGTKAKTQPINTADVDIITQELIDGGYFAPVEVESGEMLGSMTRGKLKHNEEIRNAINAIDGVDSATKEKYWNRFY